MKDAWKQPLLKVGVFGACLLPLAVLVGQALSHRPRRQSHRRDHRPDWHLDATLAADHPGRDTSAPSHRLEPIDPTTPDAGAICVFLRQPAFLDVSVSRPILRYRRHHCRRHGPSLHHRRLCQLHVADPFGRDLHDCHDQAPRWQMVAAPAPPGVCDCHWRGGALPLASQSRYSTTAALWRNPSSSPGSTAVGTCTAAGCWPARAHCAKLRSAGERL